jgi:hypothetical protein
MASEDILDGDEVVVLDDISQDIKAEHHGDQDNEN